MSRGGRRGPTFQDVDALRLHLHMASYSVPLKRSPTCYQRGFLEINAQALHMEDCRICEAHRDHQE